ncbi:MAG TPA: hotdog fold thioesterase [Niabella sp.]|nr:hotdog fold thioesterase [Niabella sp.]HOZ95835.1 hotdog fold thioesterase [Niabella sp.]HQW13689.1 hotdog fold thioesterase [Niabella sp.]HQX19083.1 hotdog fold thioesterase [Niabella sp.]HQX42797.1 hotdog fold thioesterase [Niabella sp.]
MIWSKTFDIDNLNNRNDDNMAGFLGIKFTTITDTSLEATMPVTNKTRQPYGILHGGASVALAETVGSYASTLVVDREKSMVVGMEINANHIKPVLAGYVRAVCSPIHLGKSSHVWDIRIYNDAEALTCVSRLTVAIIERRKFT